MKDASQDIVDSTVQVSAFNLELKPEELTVKTIVNYNTEYSAQSKNPECPRWRNLTQSRVALYGKQSNTHRYVEVDKQVATNLLNVILLADKSNRIKTAFENVCQNEKITLIEIKTDDSAISNLPWESCVKADWSKLDLPVPTCNLAVVRTPKPPSDEWNLSLDERVRILVAGLVDDANTTNTPPSFHSEYDAIEESLQELSPELFNLKKFTGGFTISDLGRAIEEYQPHILHLIAHGAAGQAEMRNSSGGAISVSSALLSSTLQRAKNSLVMFISTACLLMKDSDFRDTLGIGNVLINHIPIVVGMQLEISHLMSRRFTGEFYQSLANSNNILDAFIEAREAIWDERRDSPEWISPVVYSKTSGDKYIFPLVTAIGRFLEDKLKETDNNLDMLRQVRLKRTLREPFVTKITELCNSLEKRITEPFSKGKLKLPKPKQETIILELDGKNLELLGEIIDLSDVLLDKNPRVGKNLVEITKIIRDLRSILERLYASL